MDKEDFLSLPATMQIAKILDALPADVRSAVLAGEKPRTPGPPKYDYKMYRRGGYCWASEMNIESLRYWHKKASESAVAGGQYADKDAKKAKQLDYWVSWRAVEPESRWTGERDHRGVTAEAPGRDPRIHANEDRSAPPAESDSFGGASDMADDDIPF